MQGGSLLPEARGCGPVPRRLAGQVSRKVRGSVAANRKCATYLGTIAVLSREALNTSFAEAIGNTSLATATLFRLSVSG